MKDNRESIQEVRGGKAECLYAIKFLKIIMWWFYKNTSSIFNLDNKYDIYCKIMV